MQLSARAEQRKQPGGSPGQCSRPGALEAARYLGWAPFPSPPFKGTPQPDETDIGGNGQKQEEGLQGHPTPTMRIYVQEQRGEEGEKDRGGEEKTEEN